MASNLGYDGSVTCSFGVSDMAKTIEWCTDKLGFELLYKMDEMGWCEMQTHIEGVRVGFSQVEDLEVKGGATLTWGVNDIAAARKELEGKGVRFDGETMTFPGMVSLATFFDPDGNKYMLFQNLSEH